MSNSEQRSDLQAYKQQLQIALAGKNLYEYVKLTNRGYLDNRFGKDLCKRVQDFIFDKSWYPVPQIMIICAPPQHGKSMNITESLPAFYLGVKPDNKVIGLSYGDELARRFGMNNLTKVMEYGRTVFGEEVDRDKPCTSLEFHIKGKNGQYLARGLTSGVTGNPADLCLVDDPIKSKEDADSENFRNKSWDGYLANIKTRLSANAKVIVILTRWHEDDLAGRIEAYGNVNNNVTVIKYPCECDDESTDPLGRKIGEALGTEIGKGIEWVKGMKADYMNDPSQGGRRTWEALFQGRPAAMEGNIVQAIWFKFWKPKGMTLPPVKLALSNGEYFEIEAEELPEKYDSEIQSWDCTFKDNKTSDYVCGGLWKRRLSNYYLIDCYHKQASFTDTIEAIKQMTRTYPGAIAKYIEDRANGTAVISSLKSQISGIIAVDATDDKIARLNAVTPVFQSGNVYLPHPKLNSWTEDMIKELLDFPNGAHDDFVDMLSQALNKLMYDNHNTDTRTVPKGTWAYQILKERGYSDLDILGAYKNGDIKLYMIPDKLKKRFAKWG